MRNHILTLILAVTAAPSLAGDNGTALPMMAQIAVLTSGAMLTYLVVIRPEQKRMAVPA